MLRAVLLCAAALICFSVVAFAQPAGDKKADSGKGKDDTSKDAPKQKTSLDQIEEWLAMKERIKTLERQLKGDRRLPSSCKLTGKLVGDFLVFRADYVFATDQPKTTVLLGLQGGHLTDEGELDKQPAILDYDKDDGFTVRVDKEGNPHRLILNFRVSVKKSLTVGAERSIELGLPATAATMLNLDFPAGVKEVRWNGNPEKPVTPGRWQIGLEKSKTLNLAWKDPAPASANAPIAKVESQVKVDVDATHVTINADLFLEDSTQKMDEWQIFLPAEAKVDAVKAPPGLKGTWLNPGDQRPYHTLKCSAPTAERWQVSVSQRVPRPKLGGKLAVGPFQVLGAAQQQGIITVKMPAEVSLGQRLVFARLGGVNQTKNGETESAFQFVVPPATDKGPKNAAVPKAPLELEWRFEKNQVQTEVDHSLKLRTVNQGWEIDARTEIKVTALFAAINAIDIKLPLPPPRDFGMLGTAAPALAFPGNLPWGGLWKPFGMPWVYAKWDQANGTDEFILVPLDAVGKTRVLWTRGPVKQMTIKLKNTFSIPPSNQRIRLDLPQPLNTLERRTKLSIQADERTELLHGPEGAEEPVPGQHRFNLEWDQAPAAVDLAWRPHHREVVTHSVIDIDLHENSAEVRQTLRLPRDLIAAGPDAKNAQIALRVPRGIKVAPQGGWEIINQDQDRQTVWIGPLADNANPQELVLHYDLPVVKKLITVTPVWPGQSSQQDVKVRVWTAAAVRVQLTPDALQRGIWKERSIELVREREQFPALVLAGYGSNLPLALQIDDTSATSLAAFLADRALVQVRMTEDGSQQCLARYLVRKINAPFVDVELPLPMSRFREPPTFALGGRLLTHWKKLDVTEKVIRLQLHPEHAALPALLEIAYTIPADALERSSDWFTTLHAPVFRSDVVIGQMRWQLTTQAPSIAASLGRNVRAETQWSWPNWLPTPEPALTSADADARLLGKEPAPGGDSVTFSFTHVSFQPETVYHLPRQGWLLGCSGIFLIITLGAYFSPLPRRAFVLLLVSLAVGLVALVIFCPGAWAGVLFGLQPGVLLFVLFTGVHWLLQERYRRQLVFLPGFTRPKSGSTIVRSAGAKRPREASTVDAPPGSAEAAAAKPAGSQSGS